MRMLSGMENLLQEFRLGLRTFRKNPGFATLAILTLAIGIGANTGVLSDLLSLRESQRKFNALLLGSLAFIALLLATVGIYGTVSYWVKQHTPEIGIRMALGADRKNIFAHVIKNGMQFIFAGIALGIAGALAAARVIASLLFGVTASDPATFAAIAILLTFVALVACWIPARRAMRVDPMVALRYE